MLPRIKSMTGAYSFGCMGELQPKFFVFSIPEPEGR